MNFRKICYRARFGVRLFVTKLKSTLATINNEKNNPIFVESVERCINKQKITIESFFDIFFEFTVNFFQKYNKISNI